MFKGFRDGRFAIGLVAGGLLSLFGLVWVIGLNYCPGDPCRYQKRAENPQQYVGENEWEVPKPFRPTFSAPIEPKNTQVDDGGYTRQGLRAQERMAHATDWIAWIAFASAGFSIVGIGLLFWTLAESRKVTEAANKTNQIMQDEQRPWLSVDLVSVKPIMAFNSQPKDRIHESNLVFKTQVTVRNSGKIPARNVRIRGAFCVGENRSEMDRAVASWRKDTVIPGLAIPPGGTIVADEHWLSHVVSFPLIKGTVAACTPQIRAVVLVRYLHRGETKETLYETSLYTISPNAGHWAAIEYLGVLAAYQKGDLSGVNIGKMFTRGDIT